MSVRWIVRSFVSSLTVLALFVSADAETLRDDLNLRTLQNIPVFDAGRKKPFDTLAREVVEKVCGRESPTLDPRSAVTEEEWASPAMSGARQIFPDGNPRKFAASELLLSWIVEPEKWETIPFLEAKHEEVRKVLGVPLKNEENEFIAFASPAQIYDSIYEPDGLEKRRREINEKRAQAQTEDTTFQPTGADKKIEELSLGYYLFRSLTYDPRSTDSSRARVAEKAQAAIFIWHGDRNRVGIGSTLDALLGHSSAESETGSADQLSKWHGEIRKSLQAVIEKGTSTGWSMAPEEVEPDIVRLVSNSRQLADHFAARRDSFAGQFGQKSASARNMMRELTALTVGARDLAMHAKEMHLALYDMAGDRAGGSIRVVPALNAAALEKSRDAMQQEQAFLNNDAQPWLTLQTVLYGSDEVLKDYPQAPVWAVRSNFAAVAAAFRDRDAKDRAEALDAALDSFAQSLRVLGNKIEPVRRALPIVNPDDQMLAYTAYPEPGFLDAEVRYNRLQPFLWSWIISLAAVGCFSLSFGAMRKPMFWLGMAIMLFGLGWVVYGFYLRILVTRWAPVTNMYETVVYVPFFVSALALWFAWLPVTWNGIRLAWRTTAFPFTWESADANEADRGFYAERHRHVLNWNWLLVVPRVALMCLVWWILGTAPYAAGDRTIINVVPQGGWSSLNNLNDQLTWAVGMLVFLPSVWYLPRVLLSALLSLVTVPWSMKGRSDNPLAEVTQRWPFVFAGSFVAFFGSFVAWYSPVLDESFTPLQPVLRDNFWLTIHVLTIVSSYGAGALAWGLGNIALAYYLFGKYRTTGAGQSANFHGIQPAGTLNRAADVVVRPPAACAKLADYIYKAMQVAVLLLAAGTILGGLWADVSWGRFWGWDPKEVWALISLLVYLAILHGRFVGWFGNFGLAIGSVLGASAIIFSWYGVNFYLGVGLHSYGFGAGGQFEVLSAVLLNWVFLAAAAIRYRANVSLAQVSPARDEVETSLAAGLDS